MPRLYKKDVFVLVFVFVFIPFAWLALFSGSGLSNMQQMSPEEEKLIREKEELETKIKELKEHMMFLENLRSKREEETNGIKRKFVNFMQNISQLVNGSHTVHMAQLLNLSAISSNDIIPPSIFDHLPYLKGHSHDALMPAFKMSRDRTAVSVVLGIPSVKREKKSYLFETLTSLINNLSYDERKNCLIVVFIAEPNDLAYAHKQGVEINKFYRSHIESGLLEVVSPSAKFYPDFKTVNPNLGDTKERTVWRTKQNLDFCYLMMYARTRGRYYVQLEDDVITKPGYLTTMLTFATNQRNPTWFMLEFSQLGFIGKMFKTSDLQYIIQFLAMFHVYKPCDWLVDHFLWTRVCRFDKNQKYCSRSISEIRIRYKPSLFQHIGIHSSLKGKIQKLKDKDYGKVQLHWPHVNPPAHVETTLDIYQKHTIDKAYRGDTYFWATLPKKGDTVTIELNPPITLERIYFRCGNVDHTDDRFYNTTIEIKPQNLSLIPADIVSKLNYNKTIDDFYIVGDFSSPEANVIIEPKLGNIEIIRLHIQEPSNKWIILSEILIKPLKKS